MWCFLFSSVAVVGHVRRGIRKAVASLALPATSRGLLPALALVACAPAAELELADGWVRALPPGSRMSAAYGTLRWRGGEPLVITAWRSDAFHEVSLHRTVQTDSRTRMEPVPDPAVPPGGTLVLEPGGLHLMLMRPSRDVQPGDSVAIMLTSDTGRSFRFALPVESR